MTIWLSVPLGPVNLMIAAVIFLELAVFCVYRLERNVVVRARAETQAPTESIGGSAFAAIPELVRSPYILGIGVWVALLSYAATIIYFEQAHIVSRGSQERGPSDADFCQHRSRGECAHIGHAITHSPAMYSNASAPGVAAAALAGGLYRRVSRFSP